MDITNKFDNACYNMNYFKAKRLLKKDIVKKHLKSNRTPFKNCIGNYSFKSKKKKLKMLHLIVDNDAKLGTYEITTYGSLYSDRSLPPLDTAERNSLDLIAQTNDFELVKKAIKKGEKFSENALINYEKNLGDKSDPKITDLIKNNIVKK